VAYFYGPPGVITQRMFDEGMEIGEHYICREKQGDWGGAVSKRISVHFEGKKEHTSH